VADISLLHNNTNTHAAMTKEITYGRKIEVTGYRPTFAAKSIFNLLNKMGATVEMKEAKHTNSLYISGELGDREIDIRVSDHSKAIPNNVIGNYSNEPTIRINENWIEADITSAAIFAAFKAELSTIK
jgi:hypothetical protein